MSKSNQTLKLSLPICSVEDLKINEKTNDEDPLPSRYETYSNGFQRPYETSTLYYITTII